jgi:hypothetical protein
MKLDALEHPKTYELMSVLKLKRPHAIGHLELLWAFVGKNAPQGNIGKWSNGAIARACEWDGDADEFVNALVAARLLDVDETHRLLVHDWHEHAPGWVRAKVKDKGFIQPTLISTPPSTPEGSPRGSPPSSPGGTGPSILGKGSVVQGSEGKGSLPARAEADSFELITAIKTVYPAGLHRGDHWSIAEREVRKRLDEGVDPEDLLIAAREYAAQQSALGKIGQHEVMRPSNFFATGAWRGPFPLPKANTQTDANISAGLAFLAGGRS